MTYWKVLGVTLWKGVELLVIRGDLNLSFSCLLLAVCDLLVGGQIVRSLHKQNSS